ncbi:MULTISPECIES: hypothetical protein [Enterobacteriaceae]|jgi:hypothetical protein|uniref:Prophage protein n=2 Tax=Enterobacteriaceae TaxID=543 RepID=A0ABX3U7T4_KLUIN|nr:MULTISPECIES: hypothetical protein [Enterobacteriaceae]MDU7131729.1 hypothetical protein [Enterobacteriaceae bacterium]PTA90428.1 hypothetical protein C9415_21930 [Kluyvera sp. Nf5]PXW46031.1 hypothetical protein DFO55_1514 [Grimontella sp. AG753]QIH63403.1 hypothetical protein CRX67_09890 [Enterobacteriaceae bacterium A-F18]SFF35199.1 hypothetical protein SAMN05216563_1265 [Phytobacter palmae]SLK12959.1 hypothetical protein SAMN03159434_109196 [Enterobacter sp. NFR05]
MENERLTNIPDFFGELDGGVFENKLAAALNEVALGVLNNGQKGKVQVTFDLSRLSNSLEEKRVTIQHRLSFTKPTPRGKSSEEDTTETPMYVNRGGKLTVLQEDQGQLFTLGGDPAAKLAK